MKTISIVVSVYNEEKVLEQFFAAMDAQIPRLPWKTELLFVNDGSSDESLTLLEQYVQSSAHARVISLSRNFGHEAAMIAGLDYASGDGVICMDADLQHPPESLVQILAKLDEGYDVITMVRTRNRSAGPVKNLTSGLFYGVINALSRDTRFEPNASDFFALSRRAAEVLRRDYREKVRFLRGYIQNMGFRHTSLSYTAAERAGGSSHYSLGKLMTLSANTIVCFSDLPLKLGIYAGLTSGFLGLLVLIYSLIMKPTAPSGYTTIVTLICFMFAVLFLMVGIIGQYIAVLFAEIKGRPIYLVDRIIEGPQRDAEEKTKENCHE